MDTTKSYNRWIYHLEDELNPDRFRQGDIHNLNISDHFIGLKKRFKEFRLCFIEMLNLSKKQAAAALLQLVFLSDIIYNYLISLQKTSSSISTSPEIRQLYQTTLSLLESLIENCGKYDTEIINNLPLTAYSIQNVRIELRYRLERLKLCFKESDIDPELRELVICGIKLLISRKVINRADVKYATVILNKIDETRFSSNEEMENFLYRYDFNTPSFFNFMVKKINSQLLDTPNLHTQLETFIAFEDRINGLLLIRELRWSVKDESIREQLRNFAKEKKLYIRERIKLRRVAMQDNKMSEESDRMQVNLPVAQFGLFIRLFIERGILQNEEVGKTFAYYARHFRTPRTPFISAESLQKKSTDIDFSTAKKMKGHLISMVNWLNKHHNTSGIRDS